MLWQYFSLFGGLVWLQHAYFSCSNFCYFIALFSPLDMDKKTNIATDGANSAGIGFVLYQNANDLEEGKNVKIIKANSSGLKDSQKQYSAIDTELLALKFACDSSYYYL